MADDKSTLGVGSAFESKVAACYEALGFRIDRNVSIGGHQIDLLATRYVPGANILSYVIEAKFRAAGVVGINEITPFINTARDLLAEGEISGAVMVTNCAYSEKAAGKVLRNRTIKLLTMAQLQTELFATSESLFRCCSDYERSDIAGEYIPLAAEAATGPKPQISDVVSRLNDWTTHNTGLMTLVGDFGSGKTTVMDRLFYDLAKTRLDTGEGRYPVKLKLRSLLSYPTLWTFIYASLRDSQYITPAQSVFDSVLAAGGFVILLDGFDEIHTGATASDRAQYLKRLAPLLASPSPCILSTRPTYFDSFREMTRILSDLQARENTFERLERLPMDPNWLLRRLNIEPQDQIVTAELSNTIALNPLGLDDIRLYLKTFRTAIIAATGHDEDYLITFLFRIYDLKDLLRRPLLLNMAVVSIVEGGLDITKSSTPIGPSTLYEMYTQVCAARDASKKGASSKAIQFLTVKERLEGCREIAMAMLRKGSIELQASEIFDAVSRISIGKRRTTAGMARRELLERAVTDIRLCSFLSLSDDGILRFAHKSFFEFFVAQTFLLEVRKRLIAISEFARLGLTKEVVGFLGSYARDDPSFAHNVEMAFRNRGGDKAEVDALFHRIVIASGVLLERLTLPKAAVADVELRRATVADAHLTEITLSRVVIEDVTATGWKLEACTLTACGIANSAFIAAQLNLRGGHSILSHVSFDDSELHLRGDHWDLENVAVRGGEMELDASGRFQDLILDGVDRLFLGPAFRCDMNSRIQIAGSAVHQAAAGPWYDSTCAIAFKDCVLLGLFVEANDVAALLGRGTAKRPRLALEDCEGIILTRGAGGLLGGRGAVRVERGGSILVVDADVLQSNFELLQAPVRQVGVKGSATELRAATVAAEARDAAARFIDQLRTVDSIARRHESLTGLLAAVFKSPKVRPADFAAD
jgi:hypothetical protein